MSVEDYISHKCKEGCVHLKTKQMLAKEYMERAEKNIIFDVKILINIITIAINLFWNQ